MLMDDPEQNQNQYIFMMGSDSLSGRKWKKAKKKQRSSRQVEQVENGL